MGSGKTSNEEDSDEDNNDGDMKDNHNVDIDDPEVINATVTIQSGFRGYQAREEVKRKKNSGEDSNSPNTTKLYNDEDIEAIMTIQAGARGYAARKELSKQQPEMIPGENIAKNENSKSVQKPVHTKHDSEDYDSGTSMSSQNSIIRLEKSNEPIPIVNGVIKVASIEDNEGTVIQENKEDMHGVENDDSLSDSLRSTMETSDYVTSSSDNSMSAPIRAKKTPFSLLKRFVNLMSASNVRKHKVGIGSEQKRDVKYSKSTNDLSSKETVDENGIGSEEEDSARTGTKSKKLSKRHSKSRNSLASEPSSTASNSSKSSVRSSKLSKSSKVAPSTPVVSAST